MPILIITIQNTYIQVLSYNLDSIPVWLVIQSIIEKKHHMLKFKFSEQSD